jgi:predicted enzyme related to lactoylglutathione lyase
MQNTARHFLTQCCQYGRATLQGPLSQQSEQRPENHGMNVETFFINLTSEHPERLLEFYRDTVGIPQDHDFGPHSLNANGVILGIDAHSETRGPALEPHRYLLDFTVNGFDSYEARLDAAGVECIRRRGTEPWGATISTYKDPDGNYFQFFEYQPDPGAEPGIQHCTLNLTSEDPAGLSSFYHSVVGLPGVAGMGDGALRAGNGMLILDGHSDVRGRASEPHRWLIDFWVSDVDAEEKRLIDAGVPLLRSKGVEFWGGVISCFEDPDGNYFQLIQHRPELMSEGTF